MNRGIAVPMSYKLITPVEQHTEENLKLANIVGWCIELVGYNSIIINLRYLTFEIMIIIQQQKLLFLLSFFASRCKHFS